MINEKNELFFEEKNEVYKVIDDDYNLLKKQKLANLILKKNENYSFVIQKISSNEVMVLLMFFENSSPYKLSHIHNNNNGKSTILKLELCLSLKIFFKFIII